MPRRTRALWRCDYNHVRPHSSLAGVTPAAARPALEQSEGPAPGLLDRIGRPKDIADLTGAPFLAYSPISTGGRVRLGLGPDAPEVRMTPVLQSANETVLFQAALEGMGIAIMPHLVARAHLAEGRLERLLPDIPAPVVGLSAIYPDRSYLPAKTRTFLDFLAGPEGFEGPLGAI